MTSAGPEPAGDGLEAAVVRLVDMVGALRAEMRRRTVALVGVLLVVVLVGFGVSVDADRRIDANTRQLATVTYRQCQTQDATNKRQIELIDSAIAAERRKPAPDRRRIADLEQFKPSRIDCGPAPSH
jgi:type II secretory pathway pseudopilin PulG